MKVLLINQYYAPDEAPTAQLLGDLGATLAASGASVEAICSNRSYAQPARRLATRELIDGVEVRRVRTTGFGRSRRWGRLLDYGTFLGGTIVRLCSAPRPDVIVVLTTPPMLAIAATFIGRLRGAATVFWSMDVYPDLAYELGVVSPRSMVGRLLALLARRTVRAATTVVALGDAMAARIREQGARDVQVIHNWSDESENDPDREPILDVRSERGWTDRFIVAYSGNMGLAHEFDTIVGAARAIASGSHQKAVGDFHSPPGSEAHLPVRFAFIGGGTRKAEVVQAVEQLRLENVEFYDYVEQPRLHLSLAAADVHLITLRERMAGLLVPSKLYGILGAGKPTIYVGPAEGEVYDILREGECGTCVRIGDVGGLVAAIMRYRAAPELVEEEGRRARRILERSYSRRASLEKWLEVIRRASTSVQSDRTGVRSG